MQAEAPAMADATAASPYQAHVYSGQHFPGQAEQGQSLVTGDAAAKAGLESGEGLSEKQASCIHHKVVGFAVWQCLIIVASLLLLTGYLFVHLTNRKEELLRARTATTATIEVTTSTTTRPQLLTTMTLKELVTTSRGLSAKTSELATTPTGMPTASTELPATPTGLPTASTELPTTHTGSFTTPTGLLMMSSSLTMAASSLPVTTSNLSMTTSHLTMTTSNLTMKTPTMLPNETFTASTENASTYFGHHILMEQMEQMEWVPGKQSGYQQPRRQQQTSGQLFTEEMEEDQKTHDDPSCSTPDARTPAPAEDTLPSGPLPAVAAPQRASAHFVEW